MGAHEGIDRVFRLRDNGTDARTELFAGLTTFLTMAYIIFLQPAILSGVLFGIDTGMDFGAVTTATCLSAALATAIMGLYARYPVAQAPGMGQNFFFVLTAIPAIAALGHPRPWAAALGVVFVAGVLFLILSLAGVRHVILDALSQSMRAAIASGIGLLIAFIGLQNAGLVIDDPVKLVRLNPDFASPDLIVFFVGLVLTASLAARGVRSALLLGIAGAVAAALALRLGLPLLTMDASASSLASSRLFTMFQPAVGIVSTPPSMGPTFLQMDVAAALSLQLLPLVLVFLYMDVFDTLGTLIGVTQQAGLMKDGKLPRARRAMVSDAVGTVFGAATGTSTVTSYIESAAGVAQGGRTGLTAVTTASLFLVAPFFSPVIAMVGSYPPITASALVIVGVLMAGNIGRIAWDDASEAIPAFLVLVGMPLTGSVGDGMALGFVAYPVVKTLGGHREDVGWLMWTLAAALLAYFVLLRGPIG